MNSRPAIKEARIRAGLTMAELGELCGVKASTVAGWEAGTHGIRSTRLGRVAKALNVTVDDLVAA